jgi:hypothetical protein
LTAVAVILIVLGVLVCLLGVLFLLAGSLWGTIGDMPDFTARFGNLGSAFGGFIATVGALVLAYGVLHVVSGIYVLPGRSWARITGMIVGCLGALFSLVGLAPGQSGYSPGGLLVTFVVLACYAWTVYALATRGSWFARR